MKSNGKPLRLPLPSSPSSSYRPEEFLTTHLYDQVAEPTSTAPSICPEVQELAQIQSRYIHKSPLGKGALKEVFKCFDLLTKRNVAWAKPAGNLGAEFYDLFLQEAWLTSSLSHPNIIKVHDAGVTEEGCPFFTMDLKRNTTLKSLKEKTSDLKILLSAFLKICDAISYAHAKGIIHLDLKPENIQCDRYGEVLVCDWGLAKKIGTEEIETEEPSTEHLTITQHITLFGEIRGTLGYMAPEQVLPEGEKTKATDIFALGCLLHFILLNVPPFQGSKKEIIQKTITADLSETETKLKALKLPKSLSAIVIKTLQVDPRDRYTTTIQLRNDLERFLHGFATRAESPGILRKSRLLIRRHQRISGVVVSSLILLACLSAVYWSHLRKQEDRITAEKGRADTLEEEIVDLTEEFGMFQDLPEWSKKRITAGLVEDSETFRKLFWQADPVVAVRENRALLKKLYELQPDNPNIVGYLCRADFNTMNFQAVLAYPLLGSSYQKSNRDLARLSPDYAFSETFRPPLEKICAFYEKMTLNASIFSESMRKPKLYAIMMYDWELREDKSDYYQVVSSLIQSYNPDAEITSRITGKGERQLHISSTNKLTSGFDLENQRYRVFNYLEIDTLKLKLPKFKLSELHQATIGKLDLSKVKKISLSEPIFIQGLEKVICPESISSETIKENITSNGVFEIIRPS